MWLKQQGVLQLNLILLLLLLTGCSGLLTRPQPYESGESRVLTYTLSEGTKAASAYPAESVPPQSYAQDIPDGMGGTLLLDPDIPVAAAPPRIPIYQVRPQVRPSLSEVERWAQAWDVAMPWVGKSLLEPARFIAVGPRGQAVVLGPREVVYYERWPSSVPLAGDEIELQRAFRPFVHSPFTDVRLQMIAIGPSETWYRAEPLLNGMPLTVNPPWGEAQIDASRGLKRVKARPLTLVPAGLELLPEPFTAFLTGLQADPPRRPLARYIRPLVGTQTGHFPLARRPSTLVWRPGLTVELAGRVWVYQGGNSGKEVRAWLRSPDGVFELWPVSNTLLARARAGEILVKGVLERALPKARWGVVHVRDVLSAPQTISYKGTLFQANDTVILRADSGKDILLPGAPLTLAPGIRVIVNGYKHDATFEWRTIYLDIQPPDRPLTIAPYATRQVLRVEPAYWFAQPGNTSPSISSTGRLIPVWQVTTQTSHLEEILIYPMEGKTQSQ